MKDQRRTVRTKRNDYSRQMVSKSCVLDRQEKIQQSFGAFYAQMIKGLLVNILLKMIRCWTKKKIKSAIVHKKNLEGPSEELMRFKENRDHSSGTEIDGISKISNY